MRFSGIFALAAAVLLATCTLALAQALSKTWVSNTGADTGACGLDAPCATFNYAYNQTTAGGEIEVKDSGQYGILTITHAISIISTNAAATIGIISNGAGITVSAGVNDVVTLRGLIINGHGAANTYGVLVYGGKTVSIDNCIITSNTYGIYTNSTSTSYMVTNNTITQNTNGITLYQNATFALSGNRITANQTGIFGYKQ